jgi:hypothetical protein
MGIDILPGPPVFPFTMIAKLFVGKCNKVGEEE